MNLRRSLWLLATTALLAACAKPQPAVTFHADSNPQNLADWHVVEPRDGYLALNHGVEPYAVNAKLFADYAHKLRTLWMPKGAAARYQPREVLDFPVGTIISKTFYYPLPEGQPRNAKDVALSYAGIEDYLPAKGLELAKIHLVETRLLVHRKTGWSAITYIWNADQTRATLAPLGAMDDLELVDAQGARTPFTYVVPSEDQCQVCHNVEYGATGANATRHILPIGPTARQLNRNFPYASGPENQLTRWARMGWLSGLPALAAVPRNADWLDPKASLDARARSYLDANCAYCHNPHGEANYTALWLTADEPFGIATGQCKTPVAAGPATGGRLFDVVPGQPDASILVHRMASTRVGVMMPELGRTLADEKAVALIRDWVASLKAAPCTIVHGEAPAAP